MDSCDVLIVGGGPAGSSCARALSAAGLDVVLMDKQRFPRDKVCAGWVTPAVLDELAIDRDDYARDRVLQPIDGFRSGLIGAEGVRVDYGETVSYGIRRCEFDDYLLQRAGARLRLGEKFTGMRREDGEWIVNDRIRTPLVIGAGGHFCPVARALGAKPGKGETVVAAQEVEFHMTPEQAAACRVERSVPELYFCDDLVGYGWCFRKGDWLNIGLGREDNHRLSEHVEAFVRFLQETHRVPFEIPARFSGHAYLLYRQHQPRQMVHEGALLIGDAAGLAYPQSGEGIRPAIESALMAAKVVHNAAGDYSAERLQTFATLMQERFGGRRRGGSLLDRLPASWKSRLAAPLLASRRFTRHVVLDRWFLHRHQPGLQSGLSGTTAPTLP